MLRLYFDGACQPYNPGGHCGWGFVIYRGRKKLVEHSGYHEPGETSKNLAEYLAVNAGIRLAVTLMRPHEHLCIYGDSNLVIQQLKGRWKIRGGYYATLARATKAFTDTLPIRFHWIPREANAYADTLSKTPLHARKIPMKLGK